MNKQLDILVTLDEGYVPPLKVMLLSLFQNNPQVDITIWLIHQDISTEKIAELHQLVKHLNGNLQVHTVSEDLLADAPTVERYPKEMYFRLLAGDILPKRLKKVLYLDPDILIINPLTALFELDLAGNMFAAAVHKGITNISTGINNIRLGTDHGYYNSGVMLIDLDQARKKVSLAEIKAVIETYQIYLMLPDQDILNFLYGKDTKEIPEENWNYDTRKYHSYYARSLTKTNMHWVMSNTSILHFCGRPKPWQLESDNKFVSLYAHYQQKLLRLIMEMTKIK